MKYAFLGVTPRSLASGRPLVFGDVVDASELEPEDDALKPLLAAQPSPQPAAQPKADEAATPDPKAS